MVVNHEFTDVHKLITGSFEMIWFKRLCDCSENTPKVGTLNQVFRFLKTKMKTVDINKATSSGLGLLTSSLWSSAKIKIIDRTLKIGCHNEFILFNKAALVRQLTLWFAVALMESQRRKWTSVGDEHQWANREGLCPCSTLLFTLHWVFSLHRTPKGSCPFFVDDTLQMSNWGLQV